MIESIVKNELDLDVFPKCVENKTLQYRSNEYCVKSFVCGEFCDYKRVRDKKQFCDYYVVKNEKHSC